MKRFKSMKTAYYFFGFLLLFAACTQPPDYPDEPVIAFERFNFNRFQQGDPTQNLILTISFTDGDGDIGDLNNERNVQFMDLRDSSSFISFSVPAIPEQGASNGVSGEIDMSINVSNICCIHPFRDAIPCIDSFDDYPNDTLIYEIQIFDRSGNPSNIIRTDPLFLNCRQ